MYPSHSSVLPDPVYCHNLLFLVFTVLQSRMLNFRGTPQLVVISWKEGVYKRAIGDQEDKREVNRQLPLLLKSSNALIGELLIHLCCLCFLHFSAHLLFL